MYLCAFSFVFCTLLMSAENICHEADIIPYRLLFCRSICIHMQCTGIHRNICMECFLPVHTACNGEDADAFPLCAKHHMTADTSVAVNKRYADDLSLHLHTRKCFFLRTQRWITNTKQGRIRILWFDVLYNDHPLHHTQMVQHLTRMRRYILDLHFAVLFLSVMHPRCSTYWTSNANRCRHQEKFLHTKILSMISLRHMHMHMLSQWFM